MMFYFSMLYTCANLIKFYKSIAEFSNFITLNYVTFELFLYQKYMHFEKKSVIFSYLQNQIITFAYDQSRYFCEIFSNRLLEFQNYLLFRYIISDAIFQMPHIYYLLIILFYYFGQQRVNMKLLNIVN